MNRGFRICILGIFCTTIFFVSCQMTQVAERVNTDSIDTPVVTSDGQTVDMDKIESEMSKRQENQTPAYAPQDEWIGLETRAYPELNAKASQYILAHPEGNPDHTWDGSTAFAASRVFITTNHTEYSIAKDDEIKVTITFANENPPSGKYEKIEVYKYLNLERRNEESWERMLYPIVRNTSAIIPWDEVAAGEMLEQSFFLHNVVTVLTPGKYRIIAYVNSTPVYAEFELTE